jgi:hypothetical protein
MRTRPLWHALIVAVGLVVATTGAGAASTPGGDVRLSHDETAGTGAYVSDYTLVTGNAYTDATLAECSRSRGRQNEPAVAIDPRNTSVIVGSSNDYCGVFNNGVDGDGAPIASGPIWLGYYRSQDSGQSFVSSLVPGYPKDVSRYASRAKIRTASAGDPVLAWDAQGRLFAGAEASGDPAGSKKTLGDVWVATYENPDAPTAVGFTTANDGKEFKRSVLVARGSSAPNLLGKFQDKTAIEADRTSSSCHDNVYFANSRFVGNGGSNIYFYRSTNHGVSFSRGTLITPNVNDVQFPEIGITSNGHVYVTFDATLHNGNKTFEAIMYAKSTNCGATFSTPRIITRPIGWTYVDRLVSGGRARDCGDFASACQSGYTFPRNGTSPRMTADQTGTGENIYITYEATIPGTQTPTGTTFGSITSGTGSQGGVYFIRLNGATGAATEPKLVDPTDHTPPNNAPEKGHQFFSDVSIEDGVLHVVWYDTRNGSCYSRIRPIGNCAPHAAVVPSLDVYGTTSTDGGDTFDASTRISDMTTNAAFEAFGGRTVPFNGDYIWVTSKGTTAFTTWTDYRNQVAGTDQRETGADDGDTGADVLQCRDPLTGGGWTGDKCPRNGGLDQNIYGDSAP